MKKAMAILSAATVTLTSLAVAPAYYVPVTAADTVKIMCVGDSITDGYVYEYLGSYRKFIYNDLTELGYSIDMVGNKDDGICTYTDSATGISFEFDNANTGYSGYTIKSYGGRTGIYETLESSGCLASTSPDIVTLQIGTNDLIDKYELDTAGERLEELINFILDNISAESALFVTSVPDLDPNRDDVYSWFGSYRHSDDWQTQYDDATAEASVHAAVAQYNADVQAAVNNVMASRSNVYFVDVNSTITDVTTQLFDGVHPNNTGYKLMGDYWAGILDDYLSGKQIIVDPPTSTTTTTTTITTTTTTETTTTTSTTTADTTTTTSTSSTTDEFIYTTTTSTEYDPTVSTTTSTNDETEDTFNVSDLIKLSRYLMNAQGFELTEEECVRYDFNNNDKIEVYDLVLLRKELVAMGDRVRERFGDDFCFLEGGVDCVIVPMDTETENVSSSSLGSKNFYGAVSTALIDIDEEIEDEPYIIDIADASRTFS